MTFDNWWNKKVATLDGPVSKALAKSIAYEAWVLAMEGGQMDDVSEESVDGVKAVPDICGTCLCPKGLHVPMTNGQTPCMNTHCACTDLL